MTLVEKARGIIVRSLTPNRPFHAQWMLTRRCNYRCRGCNVWQEQDVKELSTKEVKKGLDILKELGIIEVVLSGGNPLLREDIDEIIEYASRHFVTTVYDNGSMASEKVDALHNADLVAISIDSLDPKKNDYIKGVSGSWKKAMCAVKKLQEEGIRVGVTPTISQLNLHEIIDITNYFMPKNVPIWYSLYSFDSSENGGQLFKIGKRNDEFTITDKEAMVNVCDSLMELKKKNSQIFLTNKILKAIRTLYSENKRTWRCSALQNFLMIDHLGRVAGCHLHDPVASISDLPEVWNSEKFDQLRQVYSHCKRCTYLCYIFYSLHGSVLGNLEIAREKWKSAALFFKKNRLKPLGSAKQKEYWRVS
jgi:MoaA/NifB/PqqE/SkfB family radical SAM enzyme